jgi:hypothetical protein
LQRSRRSRASRVRLRPLLPRPCLRQRRHGHGRRRRAGERIHPRRRRSLRTARHAPSKAERRSGVSGRNDDAQRKAAPSPTSRSPMQAGIGPVADRGTYAVQVTSERSAAEADTSFRALRAKFPNQLGGREPIVRRTDSLCVNGKGGWNVPHTAGCRRQLPHSRKLRARSTIGRETAGAHLRNSSSLHDEREIS